MQNNLWGRRICPTTNQIMTDNVRTFTDEHTRQRDRSTKESTGSEETVRCPECEGHLTTDTEHG